MAKPQSGSLLRLTAPFLMLIAVAADRAPPVVERWAPAGVSSPEWESHPAIDPRNGDLWFVRSDKSFSGWRILVSRCGRSGRRAAPIAMPLAARGVEADPFFTPDGGTLYYISSRATGRRESAALDIWRADRDRKGAWGRPQRLPEPVNSSFVEWFPRPASDGWLYFGSARPGGYGKNDIWRARRSAAGWEVQNAGSAINSEDDEFEFEPSSDGKWAILARSSGLYRVELKGAAWGWPRSLGRAVNQDRSEIGPTRVGQDGAFLFSRDVGGEASGELFIAMSDRRSLPTLSCGKRQPGS